MKPLIPILVLALLPALSFAQERRTPRQPAPGNTSANPARVRYIPKEATEARPQFLKENITLKLEGNFQGFVPIKIALTGNGREFTTDLTTRPGRAELAPTIITFRAQVSLDSDESYQISYSLGARIAIPSSTHKSSPNGPVTTNIEYRDITLSGNARLTPGEPLVISKLNGESLTLSVTKPSKAE